MEKLKRLISEHRKASVIGLFLILVFIGGSAMSAVNVANRRAQETQQQETQQEESSSAEQGDDEASDDETAIELTDEQQKAIEAYTDETEEFIDTLCASVWSSDTGYTLRFDDDTYTETHDGDAVTHTYAITQLETTTDQSGATLVTAVFVTDSGTHIVEYVYETGSSNDGSGTVVSTLSSSSAFELSDATYSRADAVASVSITGLTSAVTTLLDDSASELTDELSAWCAMYYPTVTTAEWSGTAYIDYNNSFVQLDFALSGDTNVNISVIYHTDSGTFDFAV